MGRTRPHFYPSLARKKILDFELRLGPNNFENIKPEPGPSPIGLARIKVGPSPNDRKKKKAGWSHGGRQDHRREIEAREPQDSGGEGRGRLVQAPGLREGDQSWRGPRGRAGARGVECWCPKIGGGRSESGSHGVVQGGAGDVGCGHRGQEREIRAKGSGGVMQSRGRGVRMLPRPRGLMRSGGWHRV